MHFVADQLRSYDFFSVPITKPCLMTWQRVPGGTHMDIYDGWAPLQHKKVMTALVWTKLPRRAMLSFFSSQHGKVITCLSAPDGPHVGPMNLAIRALLRSCRHRVIQSTLMGSKSPTQGTVMATMCRSWLSPHRHINGPNGLTDGRSAITGGLGGHTLNIVKEGV